jgi:molybdopterin-guanine dinucleotide biosynthesis protein A
MRSKAIAAKALTLAVLAGGRSRRMGRDKAFLPLGSATLLEETVRPLEGLFGEVLIVISPGQSVPPLAWRTVSDEEAGEGPLRGILTGLRNARNDACFVLACDTPGLSPRVVEKIFAASSGADIAVAVTNRGFKEPLLGVYKKSVIPEIESLLKGGERSILPLFDRVRTREVLLAGSEIPANINTPDKYRTLAGRRRPGAL